MTQEDNGMKGRTHLAIAALALIASAFCAGVSVANQDVVPICGTGIPSANATQTERKQSYEAAVYLRFGDSMPLFDEYRDWSVENDNYLVHSVVFADCKARWQIIAPRESQAEGILRSAIASDRKYSRDDLVAMLRYEGIPAVVEAFDPAHCACTEPLEARFIPYPNATNAKN
jgi:hypothetical protein